MIDIFSTLKTLWYKFCGLIDGIKVLEKNYEFLSKLYHPFIPDLSFIDNNLKCNPFESINESLGELMLFFENFGFDRFKKIPKKDIINQKNFDTEEWLLFNIKLWETITLFEIIKSNFYKRTISLEIPQNEFGYHRGIERTTGNEGFIRGGDILTEKMLKCINIPFKWDCLFSFSIQLDKLFLAHIRLFRLFNIIHINLSDELKFFGGSYFLIAHELAHSLIFNNDVDIKLILKKGDQNSYWFYKLSDKLPEVVNKFQSKIHCKNKHTQTCPLDKLFSKENYLRHLFKECLVDYFAVEISGFFYLIAFIDVLPEFTYESYIRTCFTVNMLRFKDKLKPKDGLLYDEKKTIFVNLFKEEKEKCNDCINDLMFKWCNYIENYNRDFFYLMITEFFLLDSEGDFTIFKNFFTNKNLDFHKYKKSEGEYDRIMMGNKILDLMRFNINIPKNLHSGNIKKNSFKPLFDFLIIEPYADINSNEKREKIICNLSKNIPVIGVNPLFLLNIYYEKFLEDTSIDYYTFLFSIFNSQY